MRTTHVPRALAAAVVLFTAAACSDSYSPSPTEPGVGQMTLVPRLATIQAGQVVALTAQVFDEFGEPMVGVKYTWTSSNESVATVSVGGTVFGQREGRAAITARANGQVQTSSVLVLRREAKPAPEPKAKPGPLR
jgi:uncharacterized protein YjdB